MMIIFCLYCWAVWSAIRGNNEDEPGFYTPGSRTLRFTVRGHGSQHLHFPVHSQTTGVLKCRVDTVPPGKPLPAAFRACGSRLHHLLGTPPNCSLYLPWSGDVPAGDYVLFLTTDAGLGYVNFSIGIGPDTVTTDVTLADDVTTEWTSRSNVTDDGGGDGYVPRTPEDLFHTPSFRALLGAIAFVFLVSGAVLVVLVKRRGRAPGRAETSMAETSTRMELTDLPSPDNPYEPLGNYEQSGDYTQLGFHPPRRPEDQESEREYLEIITDSPTPPGNTSLPPDYLLPTFS